MRSEALRALLLACAALLAAPAVAADLHAQVSASLMRPEQRSLRPMQWTPPPKLVALYFGADWCAPCHAFVPTLRSVRDAFGEPIDAANALATAAEAVPPPRLLLLLLLLPLADGEPTLDAVAARLVGVAGAERASKW